MPRDPHQLEVFRLAHDLARQVYRASAALPPEERFGLQAQMRRAAVSVAANLAEGCARRSCRDYQRFVEVALGSAVELRELIALAADLGLAGVDAWSECRDDTDHVVRALHRLQQAVGGFSS